MNIGRDLVEENLLKQLKEISGEDLSHCYQCGKCSAGCPMAKEMEYLPHQIIRFLQLGLLSKALESKAIWLCASCHSCASRCPQSFDLSHMMEALRMFLLRQGDNLLSPEEVDRDLLKRAPQQAFVSAFRKYSN